ncbi:DUF3267 domain-containing protein [Natronoflexus pectinivorans]|uniref:Putative zincin peptidase n=1 Tax=Natronoflexus pectinivorans TaxID=682526 RepID=A0A4R2GMT2_9BACT|nr:DUF3267 domain-containing protein [Natronoflexus pectinivorans]TCO09739.1 putative zincin peptidase [Natronoflexus pectinivorans]
MEEKNKQENIYEEVSIPVEEAARWVMRNVIPFSLIALVPFFMVFGFGVFSGVSLVSVILFIVLVLFGLVFHELLHALVFVIFSRNGIRNVSFGIEPKTRSPWCHFKGEMSVLLYRVGALTPFFVMGLFPLIYAWFNQSPGWLFFGYIFSVGGGGDWVSFFLTRNLKWSDKIKDHPSKLGFYIVKSSER